jgi:hydroxymethylbilane synthase
MNRPPPLRLGTRRSALAMTQSRAVGDALEAEAAAAGSPVAVELVEITTSGDVCDTSLVSFGGVGVFVQRVRDALRDGEIDLAVHSLKDLPSAPEPGLLLAAVPPREDPRDVLVARDGLTLAGLGPGARVGTGSPRRAAQLRAAAGGLEIVDIRGNVDTRLRLVAERRLDAVVLARAGLLRLGRADVATEVFDPAVMLPSPGQGALAVECRDDVADEPLIELLTRLDDGVSRAAVTAERSLMSCLDAGCAAPLGALGEVVPGTGGGLTLSAVVASADGSVVIRRSVTGAADTPERLGKELAVRLLDDGAGFLIPRRAGPPARHEAFGRDGPAREHLLREPATGPVDRTSDSASTPREGDS